MEDYNDYEEVEGYFARLERQKSMRCVRLRWSLPVCECTIQGWLSGQAQTLHQQVAATRKSPNTNNVKRQARQHRRLPPAARAAALCHRHARAAQHRAPGRAEGGAVAPGQLAR